MKYLSLSDDYAELGRAWNRYMEYLESMRGILPAEVIEFAASVWHYHPEDHRSLHDAWVESLCIRETASTGDANCRVSSIEIHLLGAYHDLTTTLVYEGVTGYSLGLDRAITGVTSGPVTHGHGDWLLDEITLSPNGRVLHEIAFDSGALWLIECATIRHQARAIQ
jgi:hypothetical protein